MHWNSAQCCSKGSRETSPKVMNLQSVNLQCEHVVFLGVRIYIFDESACALIKNFSESAAAMFLLNMLCCLFGRSICNRWKACLSSRELALTSLAWNKMALRKNPERKNLESGKRDNPERNNLECEKIQKPIFLTIKLNW